MAWIAAGLALVGLALLLWRYILSRATPEELERRRRQALAAGGKIADANLIEVQGQMLVYTYAVRGVEYTASQDVSGLAGRLPAEIWQAIGVAGVKYDPRNPANSIVFSEDWSGLRMPENS